MIRWVTISINMFIFVIAASEYMVTEYGSICSEIEKNPVVDKDECIKAAKSLEKTFWGYEEYKDYPRGCYFIDNDVYWNVTGMKEPDSAEICHKQGSNFLVSYESISRVLFID